MSDRIAVLGSGIIGLSTAVCLAEAGKQVTLVSGQGFRQTTSAVAAAFWTPYWTGDYDQSWAATTLAHLQHSATIPGTGVTVELAEEWLDVAGSAEVDAELEETYWWRQLPGLEWTRIPVDPPREVIIAEHSNPVLLTEKIVYKAPVARMPDYLSYLRDRFLSTKGSKIDNQWVDSLADLLPLYSTVVNCTGWQAVYLIEEERTGEHPMKLLAGHVARVPRIPGHPLVTLSHGAFRNRSTYIVPRHGSEDDMICGGTAIDVPIPDQRDIELHSDEVNCQAFMDRCKAFEPRLDNIPVKERLLGFRPVRKAVRIERDSHEPRIIHNYGHGGSGLTLSWGSAERVREILETA